MGWGARTWVAAVAASLAVSLVPCGSAAQMPPDTVMASEDGVRFRVEVVTTGVEVPSALEFLPDGRLLLAERPSGRLSCVDLASGIRTPVRGVPPVFGQLDAGLHDVVAHPDFGRNHLLYLSYSEGDSLANALVVSRARLEGDSLVAMQRIFRAVPALDTAYHYGGRMALQDGYLFVTVGNHHNRGVAQDLSKDVGKVVRLLEDGRVPDDNPFVGRAGARPEIWSYGHRNPQGMAVDPATGALWINEHGPFGGDELNRVRPGRDYGWPVITYGREYEGGPVGRGITHHPGMEQPVYVFERSTAPSDMLFYTGDAFPAWRASLFNGAMGAVRHLNRLVVEDGRVLHEERLLKDLRWRIRSLAQGPDGFLYLGVDQGMIVRIVPG